jgi:N-acetylglutamate synthase-like GNAT family acetyltransferase
MIRQFRVDDAQPCSTLIRECLTHDSSIPSSLRKKLLRLETPQMMEERSKLFYVAIYESEGRVLGIAGLDMNEIRLLCVSPEHRRSHIGKVLLEYILGMVPAILFADVIVYSSIEGRAFYKSCGFIEKGPVNYEIDGELLPTIFMALPIR